MILQALSAYYDRLKDDSDKEIAPFGFRYQSVHFCIVLDPDGSVANFDDLRIDGKKLRPRRMILPYLKTRSSGDWANFLWDNTSYVLGVDAKNDPEKAAKRFELFRKMHHEFLTLTANEGLNAVCKFLNAWNPESAQVLPNWDEICGSNIVFRIRGKTEFMHESQDLNDAWARHVDSGLESAPGISLLSDEEGEIAVSHPLIQGVRNCNTSGAALISFNKTAFRSYGKDGNTNSPITLVEAFKYVEALNHLLKSSQRIQIGDATTVFWTEQPSAAESFMGQILGGPATEDESLLSQLSAAMKTIANGDIPTELGDPETKFYILGLSPNAARISIRFWHVSTLEDMVKNLRHHFADLAIVRSSDHDPEYPAVWQLLRAIALRPEDIWRANDIADKKKGAGISPQLAGALMRSVLMGLPYPDALYAGILRRFRTNQQNTSDRAKAVHRQMLYLRSAILKACLNRHSHTLNKEITMSLDPDRTEPAYHMGRLFAALEKAQEEAHSDENGRVTINTTIKDRNFSAASAVPASVFPRLIRLSQHHLEKLDTGAKIHREKNIQEICGKLTEFPTHLNLRDQGLFAIGYYHQRQDFFTKKASPTDTSEKE
jgi:CRISPR-associated protein Csd1